MEDGDLEWKMGFRMDNVDLEQMMGIQNGRWGFRMDDGDLEWKMGIQKSSPVYLEII